jgi:hypothetical protein
MVGVARNILEIRYDGHGGTVRKLSSKKDSFRPHGP